MMDPSSSVCRLHPGVAVTGFCPACLRDRLAGLHPEAAPSSADQLRRCKSFSYARSAAAAGPPSQHFQMMEPQRRSCDLFRQEQPPVPIISVPVMEEQSGWMQQEEDHPPRKSSSLGGLLGKKLLQWRGRKSKKQEMPPPQPQETTMPGRHRQQQHYSFQQEAAGGRRSCDVDTAATLWSGPSMLSVDEDCYYDPAAVPRSDGQIPVEEDDDHLPGGCAQTRDYYLDSSTGSSRRRRSMDHRSTTSGRNSFSDADPAMINSRTANSRVSPAAIAAESSFYHAHHQSSVLYCRGPPSNNNAAIGRGDAFSASFGSALYRDHQRTSNKQHQNVPAPKPPPTNKKGIKGWNIWGLIHKKSNTTTTSKSHSYHGTAFSPTTAEGGGEFALPPELLRARGYNGQMLRCNSTISARSSFSGGIDSGRRSISGGAAAEMQHHHHDHHLLNNNGGFGRRDDQVLLQRNLTTRSYSFSRSDPPAPHHLDHRSMAAAGYQFSQPYPPNGKPRSSSKKPSSVPRRSTLGLYSTDHQSRQ